MDQINRVTVQNVNRYKKDLDGPIAGRIKRSTPRVALIVFDALFSRYTVSEHGEKQGQPCIR